MLHVGVTGASGFIGRALVKALNRHTAFDGVALLRRPNNRDSSLGETRVLGDLAGDADLSSFLLGLDAIVHAAARVHVMNEAAEDPEAEFQRVNVAGTLNIARQARRAGVRRFIYISSIKVNGENSGPHPFKADDAPHPRDPYGRSKFDAEQALMSLGRETGLEVVIIRPPLVYGPGVAANFAILMRLVKSGIPLPFAKIANRRSLIYLENLIDLILTCLTHPAAANQVFLARDDVDISTTELLQSLARALGRPSRLFPFPQSWLDRLLRLSGKGGLADRLLGSLQVDIEKNAALLDWHPPVHFHDGIRKTAKAFLQQ